MTICSFPACGREIQSRGRTFGLCEAHNTQRKRGKELKPLRRYHTSLDELFAARTEQSGDCLIWTGKFDKGDGYGRQSWEGRVWLSHRLAYTRANGPIPEGKDIDHRCRNRLCVRVEHLRLATPKQNCENRSADSTNRSGYRGVYREHDASTWFAAVIDNGIRHAKHGFKTPEAAAEWAQAKRNELFTHNDADRTASAQTLPADPRWLKEKQ